MVSIDTLDHYFILNQTKLKDRNDQSRMDVYASGTGYWYIECGVIIMIICETDTNGWGKDVAIIYVSDAKNVTFVPVFCCGVS